LIHNSCLRREERLGVDEVGQVGAEQYDQMVFDTAHAPGPAGRPAGRSKLVPVGRLFLVFPMW
jgi:hypothetical protein